MLVVTELVVSGTQCTVRHFKVYLYLFTVFCKQYLWSFYRPQRSWGKVMFLHVSVILFMGGCATPPRQTPAQADTRPDRHLPGRQPLDRHPLGRHTALGRHTPLRGHPQPADTPQADTPLSRHTTLGRHPPGRHPPAVHAGIRSTNKRAVRILLECNLV